MHPRSTNHPFQPKPPITKVLVYSNSLFLDFSNTLGCLIKTHDSELRGQEEAAIMHKQKLRDH